VEIGRTLSQYWERKGCTMAKQWDIPLPAATLHPAVFTALVSEQPVSLYLTALCRRPWDSRGGGNPLRGLFHQQFEVFMRPAPANERQLIFDSLTAIGTEKSRHEIRFREDYWDIPELAIGGRGWEIFLNGIEIGQITEICEVGGIKIDPGMEITYGLERLTQALGLQKESPLTECENQYWGYLDQTVNIDSWYDLMAIYRYECENALDDQKLLPAIDLLNSMHHAYWIINRRSPMGSDEKTLHRSRMQNLCKRWVTMATGAKADAIYREFVAGTHL